MKKDKNLTNGPADENSKKLTQENAGDVKKAKAQTKKAQRSAETSVLAVPKAKRFLTFERRKSIWGYIFISPWLIGVIIFFLVPMFMAACYTFSEISVSNKGFDLAPVGFQNYIYFFREDTSFVTDNLIPSLGGMLWQVPIILLFSLFVSVLIKEKFVGRTLARAVFFLPVIVSSGVVLGILQQNILGGQPMDASGAQAAYMFSAPSFSELFATLGVPGQITKIVDDVVGQVFNLTWKSGVQILLLLAAVNNIPSSQYEVADMEGATGWEKFWKITFPMVSPTLLVALIYTIIDSFTDFQNPVMKQVMAYINAGTYDKGTTVAFIYFICVLVIIGIVNGIVSRHVFYYNE